MHGDHGTNIDAFVVKEGRRASVGMVDGSEHVRINKGVIVLRTPDAMALNDPDVREPSLAECRDEAAPRRALYCPVQVFEGEHNVMIASVCRCIYVS